MCKQMRSQQLHELDHVFLSCADKLGAMASYGWQSCRKIGNGSCILARLSSIGEE